MPIVIDQLVPDFTASATDGEFSIAALRGKKVVLYFYPKDDTPGCTSESIAFRDLFESFSQAGAVIAGISRDSLKSHEAFKTKYTLPFELIADIDEALCTLFDVIKIKKMYGKAVRGVERSTFLIDERGVLRREWRSVKVAGHVEAVLEAVQSL
ncbi:peroxiredoxin Bcp (Thioredoxin reductase) (Bacterioferritin comigratory protein homolog) [Candidatus Glomeribacter gigasporarum BEG34]|uniref:thioredoxin-dependent peroxiredoxin n=1 Tax=Candidatus Glomeribacter gigasporarum BEG34 TaxID=1070319 RepID=G2JBW4_9BURK|nr:peroxiredoxin [Candidatus Glomeribacter gigasporarum]CCD30270.1 peroxiredoxin Bcp (Thioredoxin reductase) (Bacterioferritin comigratory protein homolog) [Candidatus Glomeribacter gigasporarum BEG34]